MSVPPELEGRVTALEAQVRELTERVQRSEQDSSAARVLASGAYGDVAELRTDIREFRDSNNRTLNAMREDLTDLRSQMSDGFIEIRGRLDATAAGMQVITDMLTTLIDRDAADSDAGDSGDT